MSFIDSIMSSLDFQAEYLGDIGDEANRLYGADNVASYCVDKTYRVIHNGKSTLTVVGDVELKDGTHVSVSVEGH